MQRVLAGLVAWTLLLSAGSAGATVYRWRDADGALHFSNDSADVPPGEPEAFHSYTPRTPARVTPESGALGVYSRGAAVELGDPPGEYERGLAAGIRLGEEQVRAAAELARVMLERTPEAPSAWVPIARQQPAVSVSIVRAPRRWFHSSGPWLDVAPWFDGYPYGYPYCGYPYWSPWVVSPAFVGGHFGRFHSFRFGHHGKRGGFMRAGRGPHWRNGVGPGR